MTKPVALLCAALLVAAVGCGGTPTEATPGTVPPPQKPAGKRTFGSTDGKVKVDPAAAGGPAAKP